MKRIFLVLSICTFVVGNLKVQADDISFKSDNKEYKLEVIDSSCAENIWVSSIEEDNSIIFYDHKSDGTRYVRFTMDGKCVELTNQEILDYEYKTNIYYRVDTDDDGNYIIVKETSSGYTREGYIKTTDTNVDPSKQYYIVDENSVYMAPVPGDDAYLDTYYEQILLMRPKSVVISEDEKYYKFNGPFAVEKVDNTVASDILSYYVLDDGKTVYMKDEKVLTLSSKFNDIISGLNIRVIPVYDEFYILNGKYDDGDKDGYSAYNINGDLLFDDIYNLLNYKNELYFVDKENGTEVYNINKDFIYSIEDDIHVHDIRYDETGNVLIYADKIIGYSEEEGHILENVIYNMKVSEVNPDTGDNIVTTIIITTIALLGLILTIIFVKKNSKTRG